MGRRPLLILTRGLPGSGKTTWAIRWRRQNPDRRVRVNLDDLRVMLFGQAWTGRVADNHLVSAIATAATVSALAAGRDVVSDNTWLGPDHIADITEAASGVGAKTVLLPFDTPPEVCIERDLSRDRRVGREVITGLYERWLTPSAVTRFCLGCTSRQDDGSGWWVLTSLGWVCPACVEFGHVPSVRAGHRVGCSCGWWCDQPQDVLRAWLEHLIGVAVGG